MKAFGQIRFSATCKTYSNHYALSNHEAERPWFESLPAWIYCEFTSGEASGGGHEKGRRSAWKTAERIQPRTGRYASPVRRMAVSMLRTTIPQRPRIRSLNSVTASC